MAWLGLEHPFPRGLTQEAVGRKPRSLPHRPFRKSLERLHDITANCSQSEQSRREKERKKLCFLWSLSRTLKALRFYPICRLQAISWTLAFYQSPGWETGLFITSSTASSMIICIFVSLSLAPQSHTQRLPAHAVGSIKAEESWT